MTRVLASIQIAVILGLAGPAVGEQPADPTRICNDLLQQHVAQAAGADFRKQNFWLFDAAKKGCLDLATQLLNQGAALEARDRFSNAALLLAARGGHTDMVEFLLDQGADLGHVNLADSGALLRALSAQCCETAEALLAAGADQTGKTPVNMVLEKVYRCTSDPLTNVAEV